MADQPQREAQTPSGSRWEPDDNDDPTSADLPAAPLDDPAAEERRAQLRSRAILAGAATALTLGGGLTGFVIGHSTAADDGFRPANFSRQGPGDGRELGNQPPPGNGRDGPGPGTSRNPT